MRNNVLEAFAVPIEADEPFTVAQAKEYARISNSNEDALIGELITAARQAMERLTQLTLVPSNVTAIINNSEGLIELPLNPYVSDLVIKDRDGNELDFELLGERFKYLEKPMYAYMKATYKAGYSAIGEEGYPEMPIDLLNAIKDQFAFLYGNRGDSSSELNYCPKAYRTSLRYTRKPLFN